MLQFLPSYKSKRCPIRQTRGHMACEALEARKPQEVAVYSGYKPSKSLRACFAHHRCIRDYSRWATDKLSLLLGICTLHLYHKEDIHMCRTTSGSMNTSVGSSARMHASTYPSVGAGTGQMRPPPITLPRPSAFAPGASLAARAAPD